MIILLAFCLTGCSIRGIAEEIIAPYVETTVPATQNEQPATAATTAPTEPPTAPPETQAPAPEPSQGETVSPLTIVQPEPSDEDFVLVRRYIPDIFVDLRYATQNNFTSQKIYEFQEAWLRYGTVKKLMQVQEELTQQGFYLKIWDGFRPPSAQFKLWEVCPDATYVANPYYGFSSHSRGNTVDLTLVYADGTEVVMPTGFDDFSTLADRDYSDCSAEAAENARVLEECMSKYGFTPYSGEWWHFADTQSYPAEEVFEPIPVAIYYVDGMELISLWEKPGTESEVITKIAPGEQLHVAAEYDDFALVEYAGLWGYVLRVCIEPVS